MSLQDDLHKVFEEVRAEVAKEGTYLAHLLQEVERHFALATAEPPAEKSEPAFVPPVIEAAEPEDDDEDKPKTSRGRAKA